MGKDMLKISLADANKIFSIGEGWNAFRVNVINGTLDIKFRRIYEEGAIKFNDDGFEYKSIWVSPFNLHYDKVRELNMAGYSTPYNSL